MPVQKYRKQPVEIEAIQFTGKNWAEVQLFCGTHRDIGNQWDIGTFNPIGTFLMATDAQVTAEVWDKLHSSWVGVKNGQYIIKGLKGEFYPCDVEVFEDSYSRIDDNPDFPFIAPECFTNREGTVISYKGENYYAGCDQWVYDLADGGSAFCVVPKLMHHQTHMAMDGTCRKGSL